MKTFNLSIRLLGMVAGFLFLPLLASFSAKAEAFRGVSFDVFYDELSPYGDWVRDTRHGYVWLPAVGSDFHPYASNGHWVMTEFGNTWVSYYDWGWAPFHYGRWYFDDYYRSWAWVPGYDWGPAWVQWRRGGGYYGWAPLGPHISLSVRVGIPGFHWMFLPQRRIYDRHAWNYFASHRTRMRIINRTTIINNTVVYNNNTYITGPSRRELRRVTGRNVNVHRLESSARPGRATIAENRVRIYRPEGRNNERTAASNGRSRVNSASPGRSGAVTNPTARSPRASTRVESRLDRNNASPARGASMDKRPARRNTEMSPSRNGSRIGTDRGKSNTTPRVNANSRPKVRKAAPRSTSPAVRKSTPERRSVGTSSPSRSTSRVTPAPRTRSSSPAVRKESSRTRSTPSVRPSGSTTRKTVASPSRSNSSSKSTSRSSRGRGNN